MDGQFSRSRTPEPRRGGRTVKSSRKSQASRGREDRGAEGSDGRGREGELERFKRGKKEEEEKEEEKEKRGYEEEDYRYQGPGCSLWDHGIGPQPYGETLCEEEGQEGCERKGRRNEDSSSSSPGTSSGTEASAEEIGHLFGEEVKVKMVGKLFPGALTLNTLELMQTAVVSQSGQPWELDRSSLPPIFSQYWRMMLSTKMSGAINREAQTLCYVQDQLLQGKVASACDTVTQRLKGLEQVTSGSHYLVAQRQELVPTDMTAMTSPMESLEASRLHREEAKAKTAASRPWSRGPEWERRKEEVKGKGKGKDHKGKGRGKGDKSGGGAEDRDKDRK